MRYDSAVRAYSSVDRAPGSGPGCRGFDPLYAHSEIVETESFRS